MRAMHGTRARMLAAAAWLTAAGLGAAEPEGEPVLERCQVSFLDEADVPAEDAGVLVELLVREGDAVQKDKPIARINDDQPTMEEEKAQAELAQARAKAESTVDVEYAVKLEQVSENTFRRNEESNRRSPNTVSEQDMEKYQLEWDKSKLQIDQAKLERSIAELTARAKEVEVKAARKAIERRLIKSPLDGEVEKVHKHLGEWMQPEDPLAHVVRLDVLRVESFIDAGKWNPDEIEGREVTVEVGLERGRRETFTGRVTFVSRQEQTGGEYLVHAEVANRRGPATEAGPGGWLLRAGKRATMTIHTRRPRAKP